MTIVQTTGQFHADIWIQVDYKTPITVTGVVTKGSLTHGEFMKSYFVTYKTANDDKFKPVLQNGQPRVSLNMRKFLYHRVYSLKRSLYKAKSSKSYFFFNRSNV